MILNGPPPDGHERQCRATSRVSRQRCRKWALKGSNYCQFHGGRRKIATRKGMPSYYSKHLGPTLKAAMTELLEQPHDEMVQLYEELALARVQASQAVALAAPCFEPGTEIKAETKSLAMEMLRSSIDHVKDMCLAVQKLEQNAADKISLRVVDLFILQIVRAVYTVCGTDNQDIAQRIEAEIENRVRLPKQLDIDTGVTVNGTVITPDQVVVDMDRSITGANPDAGSEN